MSAPITIDIDADADEIGKVTEALDEIAGQIIGIGDWRPKFGRFSVETA